MRFASLVVPAALALAPFACAEQTPKAAAPARTATSPSASLSASAVPAQPPASVASSAPIGPPAAPAPPAPPAKFGSVEWVKDRWLAVIGDRVVLVDGRTAAKTEFSPSLGSILFHVMSPDAERVVLVAERGVAVHRTDGTPLSKLNVADTQDLVSAAIAPDGTRVALIGPHARIFDLAKGAVTTDLDLEYPPAHVPGQVATAFHADGKHLVITSIASTRVFDLSTSKEVGDGHDNGTTGTFAAVLSPDGAFVAAAADAGHSLRVFRTVPWGKVKDLGHVDSCANHFGVIVFTGDGKLMGIAHDLLTKVVSTKNWAPIATSMSKAVAGASAVSADASTALVVDDDGKATVFAIKTGAPRGTLAHAIKGEPSLNGDGTRVIENRGESLHVYDAITGAPVGSVSGR